VPHYYFLGNNKDLNWQRYYRTLKIVKKSCSFYPSFFHSKEPEADSPCLNADCSHICLLSPNGYTCRCPIDLAKDEECEEKSVAVASGEQWWKTNESGDGNGVFVALIVVTVIIGLLLLVAGIRNWLNGGGGPPPPLPATLPSVATAEPLSFAPVHFDGDSVAYCNNNAAAAAESEGPREIVAATASLSEGTIPEEGRYYNGSETLLEESPYQNIL